MSGYLGKSFSQQLDTLTVFHIYPRWNICSRIACDPGNITGKLKRNVLSKLHWNTKEKANNPSIDLVWEDVLMMQNFKRQKQVNAISNWCRFEEKLSCRDHLQWHGTYVLNVISVITYSRGFGRGTVTSFLTRDREGTRTLESNNECL